MKQYTETVVSTAYRIKRTVSGVKCDICGKIIPASKLRATDSILNIRTFVQIVLFRSFVAI